MARIPVVNMEIQRLALSFTHPLFFPYAKFDIDGVENIPAYRSGDHRRQPPQLLRPDGDGRHDRPHRPHRALPRQEGGLRRADRRPDRGGDGRHPGRSRHRQRRAAEGRGRGARARRHGGDHAAGHDPARQGVLRPEAEGPVGRGPAGRDDRCAGDPGRAVGNREGVAAIGPPSQRAQRRRPAAGHDPRRFSRCR